ncbi:hypothetical protein [Almyronema epifaneia]|uniref:Glucose-inhibited division protein A n=1 Tax=Almyronema epifaneia S1 TaxID=2991925 RepID=A0ABW6IEP4_9CYAN
MDRSKVVAIITGVLSLLLAVGYLLLVQILDFRGEMIPAPQPDRVGYQRSPIQIQAVWAEKVAISPRPGSRFV